MSIAALAADDPQVVPVVENDLSLAQGRLTKEQGRIALGEAIRRKKADERDEERTHRRAPDRNPKS
jgi:hypothetical protein